MSGQWPPEWGEPDQEDWGPEAEHPESAAVTGALAAIPMPPMPEAVEARITAALAAEAAALEAGPRAARTTSAEPGAHSLDTSRRRSVPPRRRRLRLRPAATIAPVITALLLSGFGFLLAQGGPSSSSSQATSTAGASASSPLFAGPAEGNMGVRPPATDLRTLRPGQRPAFVVTAQGTRYQPATLIPQLRLQFEKLRGSAGNSKASASSPGQSAGANTSLPAASASASSRSRAPSAAASGAPSPQVFAPAAPLVGCVLKVTGNVVPSLVEYATYQGKPVYVIVAPPRAWIVAVGCTAGDPRVIAALSLDG